MSFEQIESLDASLKDIDALQYEVDKLKKEYPDAYVRLMENWAVESTYNSNNIEGSTLSLGDTALVYDGVKVEAPEQDIRQAEGGFAALRFLKDAVAQEAVLSEELIKRAHELVFAEARDPKTRGAYRQVEVEITGTTFMPTPAVYVSERVSSLVASCGRSKRHVAVTAALFHLEFESIHPFLNANGRTGRLMSNFLLMRGGYEPINIQAESRARYINALRAFQLQDDPYPFVEFFVNNLFERLRRVEDLLRPATGVSSGYASESLISRLADDSMADPANDPASDPVSDSVSDPVNRLLEVLGSKEMSSSELMEALGLTHRTHFRRTYLAPALESHFIERTIPDKPNSRNQRYRRV